MASRVWAAGDPSVVTLFYRYMPIEDVELEISELNSLCQRFQLVGRILVSHEGINGTLAGIPELVLEFIEAAKSRDSRYGCIDWKNTEIPSSDVLQFADLSVRRVNEIISCGTDVCNWLSAHISYDDSFGGISGTGNHLTPEEWDATLREAQSGEQKVVLLDIRNEFEYEIGHFDGAKGIGTFQYSETFKELDTLLGLPSSKTTTSVTTGENDSTEDKPKKSIHLEENTKVLMYCTGGIRCEKASAYLVAKGVPEVYQLQGGIHRYLETFPDGGQFIGKNYVFDRRTAVTGEAASKEPVPENAPCRRIIGECIDCSTPHDEYVKEVVCVVCRMPILQCPECRISRPESHCQRHRDLSKIYFQNLSIFSIEELAAQRAALTELLNVCLVRSSEQLASVIDTPSDNHELLNYGRNRRRTLRRQIQRIDDYLTTLPTVQ